MDKSETGNRRLSEALASYLEEVETFGDDRARLRALRERHIAAHSHLASQLRSYFEDEDLFGRHLEDLTLDTSAAPSGAVGESSSALERYEKVSRIGEGAMGVVYRAFDRRLKRWVALKTSPSRDLSRPGEAERFRSEAQSMARLEHPNIVRVFDVQDRGGKTFLTMELIEGASLDRHIDRFHGDQTAIARLMVDVTRAVHHAHQRGIIHRDLKPTNILIGTDERGREHAYVSDFGLAKLLDAEAHETARGTARDPSVTAEYGKVVGTASYMSPEQASGQVATTLSDIYGLGGVLYTLLTGRAPFRGESVAATLERVKDPTRSVRERPVK